MRILRASLPFFAGLFLTCCFAIYYWQYEPTKPPLASRQTQVRSLDETPLAELQVIAAPWLKYLPWQQHKAAFQYKRGIYLVMETEGEVYFCNAIGEIHSIQGKPASPLQAIDPAYLRVDATIPNELRFPFTLSNLSAAFTSYSMYARWFLGTSEVALQNPTSRKFDIYLAVVRHERNYYYRSIKELHRPVMDEGTPMDIPILTTKPVPSYRVDPQQTYPTNQSTIPPSA